MLGRTDSSLRSIPFIPTREAPRSFQVGRTSTGVLTDVPRLGKFRGSFTRARATRGLLANGAHACAGAPLHERAREREQLSDHAGALFVLADHRVEERSLLVAEQPDR